MAKFEFTSPEGKSYTVEGPEGATQEQAFQILQSQLGSNQAKNEPSRLDTAIGAAGNLMAGAVRGAGSIGATLMAPVDAAARAVGVQNDFIGRDDRRASMDSGLQSMGADPSSLPYQAGKIGAEIAGTAGAGGVIANVAGRALPAATQLNPLLQSIGSFGMNAGGRTGAAGALTRAGGGAVSGAAQAGLVNPEDAGVGAAIGGAFPLAAQALGRTGQAVGNVMRGPQPTSELLNAAQQARNVGYVMPPTQVQPTMTNRLLEGFSGKLTTAQNASARNQQVTNRLAAEAVGLPGDVAITPEALNAVREQAGSAYKALAELPVAPPVPGSSVMNRPSVDGFNPRSALEELRQARNDATQWFAAYARSASPDDQKKAKAAAGIATAIESQFEKYAKEQGRADLVPAMQEARKLIAKTYTIEKALNPTTGTVDARKLGNMVTKGKPLTDELRTAGEFANRFPKAAQTVEQMGSLPQTSPLDWAASATMSGITANPLAMAGVMARPATRAAILSPYMQNRLPVAQQNQLLDFLGQVPVTDWVSRSAPVIGAQ